MKKTVARAALFAAFAGLLAISGCKTDSDESQGNEKVLDGGYRVSDDEYGRRVLVKYEGHETEVEIPKGITFIGESAFEGCYLSSVIIPEGVTCIEARAFYECHLSSVEIPVSMQSIWDQAFAGCSADVLYNGSESEWKNILIASNAFWNTVRIHDMYGSELNPSSSVWRGTNGELTKYYSIGVSDVRIPEGVTVIRNGAFEWCENLASVSIPFSVTAITDGAFSGCDSLETVEYGGTLAQWCEMSNDASLVRNAKSITLSDGTDLKGIKELAIPSGVTRIGYGAFSGCASLSSASIPSGVTDIGQYAFSGCGSLANVSIPLGVTYISYRAFEGCENLASVSIPSGVTDIWQYAFSGCNSLESVSIPSSVTAIADGAFAGCDSLETVEYGGTLAQWCEMSNDASLVRNAKSITLSDGTDLKGIKELAIPSGVTRIEYGAFSECVSLRSVSIPSSVTTINGYAFAGCVSLETVEYGGRRLDWNNKIRFSGDTGLEGKTIQCSDGALPDWHKAE